MLGLAGGNVDDLIISGVLEEMLSKGLKREGDEPDGSGLGPTEGDTVGRAVGLTLGELLGDMVRLADSKGDGLDVGKVPELFEGLLGEVL